MRKLNLKLCRLKVIMREVRKIRKNNQTRNKKHNNVDKTVNTTNKTMMKNNTKYP